VKAVTPRVASDDLVEFAKVEQAKLVGMVKRLGQGLGVEDLSEVEEGAGGRCGGDGVDELDVRGGERRGAMDPDARPVRSMAPRHR
jgi:hypothetical protein